MQKRKRIFLDANVLVAVGIRPDGDYSRILSWKDVQYVTSEHILSEVTENLAALGIPQEFVLGVRKIMEMTDQFVMLPRGLPLHDDEDRQALAEAIGAQCDEFVSFNSRDFGQLYGQTVFGVLVRHSGEFMRVYRPD